MHRLGTASLEKGWMGGKVKWQERQRSFKEESKGETELIKERKEAGKEEVKGERWRPPPEQNPSRCGKARERGSQV